MNTVKKIPLMILLIVIIGSCGSQNEKEVKWILLMNTMV